MAEGSSGRSGRAAKRTKADGATEELTWSNALLKALEDAGVTLLSPNGVWNRADAVLSARLGEKLTPTKLFCVHSSLKVTQRESSTGAISQVLLATKFCLPTERPFINLALQAMERPRTYLAFDNMWIPVELYERQGETLYVSSCRYPAIPPSTASQEKIYTELFKQVRSADTEDVAHLIQALSSLSKTGRRANDEDWTFLESILGKDVDEICKKLEDRPSHTNNSFRLVADSVISLTCAGSTIEKKLEVLGRVSQKTKTVLLGRFKLPRPVQVLSSQRGLSVTGNPHDFLAGKTFPELVAEDHVACFSADVITSITDLNRFGAQKARFFPVPTDTASLFVHTGREGGNKTPKAVMALSYDNLVKLRGLSSSVPTQTDEASEKKDEKEDEGTKDDLPANAKIIDASEEFVF